MEKEIDEKKQGTSLVLEEKSEEATKLNELQCLENSKLRCLENSKFQFGSFL